MADHLSGSTLIDIADEAITAGEGAATAPQLLEHVFQLVGEAAELSAAEISAFRAPAALFDAFAYPRYTAARQRLERVFEVVGAPGGILAVPPQPGDILVRRGLGEGGLGHLAFIAAPEPQPPAGAIAAGWRLEGYRPGRYVVVVEGMPRPHLLRDRFARRIVDLGGQLPLDTLILRVRLPRSLPQMEFAEQSDGARQRRLPAGKGMWTAGLRGAGTPAQVVTTMRDNGISWLAIYILTPQGDRFNPQRTLQRYLDALRAELSDPNLGFWLWGWPMPGREEQFIGEIVPAATQAGAQGVIVDVEAAWKWRRGNAAQETERRRAATALMDRLLPAAHDQGLSIGVTSYGAPWFHRNFPWTEFARGDFSLPQIYDADNNLDVTTFAPRCVDEWRALGYTTIMPISNAYSKTPEQMRLLLEHTPVTEGAISWWWWHSATRPRWAVIRDYQVPAAGQPQSAGGTTPQREHETIADGYEQQPAAPPLVPPPAVPAPDSPVADQFVAAHSSRWCSPGDRGSATCRRLTAPRTISRVIIHTLAVPTTRRRTGAQAVVRGWQRANREASAHYIIDRDGTTTQMVREADVAFHTTGANANSIGIEHADVCNDPSPYTSQVYERSAALVRDIARRYDFPIVVHPIDTTDPEQATVSGHVHHSGPGGHGDPGPYWDWEYYALLLRWDGRTAATRPVRLVWTTEDIASSAPRPAGWSVLRRRRIANDHCASHSDPYGATFWRALPDASGDPAVFSMAIPDAGVYKVSLWWPRVHEANEAVLVEIETAAGRLERVTIDQRRNRGRWVDVGAEFTVPSHALPNMVTVRILRRASGRGWIVADAVRVLKVRSAP